MNYYDVVRQILQFASKFVWRQSVTSQINWKSLR